MTLNLGDFPTGKTIYVPFHTFASTGASVTITGLATSDIKLYKDGSVTQRSSTAGFTLLDTDGIDFDGITGIHGFSIDTSDNTDSGFYAAGHEYWVVVDAVTVNAVTVSFVAATFSIDNRGLLRPATAGRTVVVDAAGLVDANMVKAGPTGSGTAQTARDIGASVLLSSGTGTGQVSLSSGAVLLQATQTGVTIPTVTTLTNLPAIPANWLTAAGTAADFTTEIQTGLATADNIVDAILDEATAGHTTAGTVGKAIIDAGGAGTPLDAAGVRAAVGLASANLDTQIAAVQSDTDNIQTRLPSALTANGNMKSSVVEFLTTALTETSGQIAAAFKQFFDVASPTGTMKAITNVVTATNLTNAPTAGDLTATMKTSVTTAATAATPTAAAVTGAVGSVTGAVGSVTGAVGSLTTNNDKTGYTLGAAGSAALTEGYAADGATATLPQLLYMLLAVLTESSVASTTLTAKKLDGSTTAGTFTLNSATVPTSITRAT